MLRQIFPFILLFFSFFAFAQPSNDTPCNATNLGSLPTPGGCGAVTVGLQDGIPVTWKINFKHQKTDDKRVVVGHVTLIR